MTNDSLIDKLEGLKWGEESDAGKGANAMLRQVLSVIHQHPTPDSSVIRKLEALLDKAKADDERYGSQDTGDYWGRVCAFQEAIAIFSEGSQPDAPKLTIGDGKVVNASEDWEPPKSIREKLIDACHIAGLDPDKFLHSEAEMEAVRRAYSEIPVMGDASTRKDEGGITGTGLSSENTLTTSPATYGQPEKTTWTCPDCCVNPCRCEVYPASKEQPVETTFRTPLKPCPLCGESPVKHTVRREDSRDWAYRFSCENLICKAGPSISTYPQLEWAIAAWNQRAPERESVNLAMAANAMLTCDLDWHESTTDRFRKYAKACAEEWGLTTDDEQGRRGSE